MIRLMKYAGAKNDFTPIINEHINQSRKSIYVEPFLGSGAVFFNLEKHFDRYILNDLDNALLFLDPPYIKRPVGYKTISPEFYGNYIEFCKTTNANILYTDIEHNDLDMTKIVLR